MTFWANQNFALLVGKTAIGAKYDNFGAAQLWWSSVCLQVYRKKGLAHRIYRPV